MKRILSLLLFVMMSLSALTPFTYAAEPRKVENEIISTIPEKIEYATREQAVLQFVNAIGRDKLTKPGTNLSAFSDYQDIDPKCIDELSLAVGNGLISGYDDRTLRPKDNIYRVEALVLLSRALKSIELVPLCDTTFTDTPEWANYDIQRLASSKIVLGYGDGTFGANDYITTEQIRVLINRITEQPTPKTDYYAYVNSEWRTFSQIPDGYPEWSDTYQLSQDIAYRMQDIVTGLLNAKFYNGMEYEPGSNEQKIIDTYLTAADMKYRDEVGLKAIQPYLELIDSAASVTDLISVMASLEKAGFHGLLPIKIETNFKNSSKYSLAFESCYTGVDTAMIQSGEYESVINKYEEYITKLLIVSGQDEKLAKGNARSVCNLCVELGKASLSSGDWNNMELLHNPYTRRDFGRLFNNIDTYKYLDELGYSSAKSVVVMDTELAKFINKYLTKENIELLKSYLRVSLLDQSSFYLNTDMYKIREEYVNFVNGTNSKVPPEGYAISIAQSMLGLEMGELYIDNFFSADAKIYVEDMAKKIIETYEKRIENLDWMGWHTKKTAIEKLKAIRIQIGYPEYIIGYTNKGFNVKGGKEGGSLMENMINFNVLKNTQNSQIITEELPVNKDEWVMLPQTVNAYYNMATNSIVIPAGILQPPYYNSHSTYEANLGGVGRIIAHEITHAFDNIGSQFDKNGNLSDWWTAEDYSDFDEKCQDFISVYDNIEFMPGVYVDGNLTLSENIADVGGMACILDLAGRDNPNLNDLFRSYAISWRSVATEEYQRIMITTDVHAPDKVRTNTVLSNFEEFYELYNIDKNDAMYVPPNERLSIW